MDWRNKPLYDRIVERWEQKSADYAKANNNRGLMCAQFRSDEIVQTDDKGQLVGQEIWNGTGPWYSRMMATGFQGSLASKNIPWTRYMMEEFKLKGIEELDIWLQDIKEHMANAYESRSNFYDVQPQFTHDGVTTGSPVMFGQEDILTHKTMWMPQHYKTIRVYYDKYNEPEGVIVQDKTWTAKQIWDTFIKKDDRNNTKSKAKLSAAVNQALQNGMLSELFTVYKAVFKITDSIWDGSDDQPFKKPIGAWKWLSVYFLELTDAENNKKNKPVNDNIGDFVRPFVIWNYDKKPWEVSSHTPAFSAVWDSLSLQQIDKNYTEDIQSKNRPAFMALDTMENRLDLSPQGQMFVTTEEYKQPPVAIDRVGGLEYSKDLMELKIEAVKRWFHADCFQMFTDLLRLHKQPVSASQIWQMAGEKSTLLSPAIETHSSYLKGVDALMMDVEIRAGRGPFSPQRIAYISDIVANILGPLSKIGVRPVFIGPLAQAMKASQALEPIISTLGAAAESHLFELYPDLRYAIKEYKTLNDIAEAKDFPQKNLETEEDYEEIKAALARKRAEDEQLAKGLEIAKATKDVSGKVEPDSILGALAGKAG